MNNKSTTNKLKEAIRLHQQGNLIDAERVYSLVYSNDPKNFEALHYLGVIEYQKKNYGLSIDLIKKSLGIKSDYAEAYANLGLSYKANGDHALALASFNKAIDIKPNNHQAYINRGNLNKLNGEYSDAIKDFSKSIQLNNGNYICFFNRGVCYEKKQLVDEAIKDYQKSIELKPDYIDAYTNLAQQQTKKGDLKEAFITLYKIIELDPKNCVAYFSLSQLFRQIGQIDNAIKSLEAIKKIDPSFTYIDGTLLHTKMFAHDWTNYHETIEKIKADLTQSMVVSGPFVTLTSIDDPLVQYKSAKLFAQDKGLFSRSTKILSNPPNEKIKIGYYSSDFYKHATSYLMAELFELHNKNKFEIYGFSFGPKCNDEMTQRIKQPFKMFFEVEDLSDKQIANLSREHKIDIAIDLKGYTKDSRSGIFSYRPAPVQVNYLGYPGTLGNLNIDYIIADKTIIPKTHQHFYSEKIAYLPNSYQVNDRKRKISNYAYTKKELGLPENGFVYCCFNYNYKITPDVFDSWSRILKRVEGSVLWLLQDNEYSNNNLKNEAILRGINPNRIIYANRLDLPLHLARHSAADLFLDTWPCNAHTTASDALWAGLPVITLIGQSFASRVCASLLNAVGLSELITKKIGDYEDLAVELAINKDKFNFIKEKLIKNKLTTPLFDTTNYVKDLESIYIKIREKIESGHPIDHIYLD